ncbi:hypothetical protein H696_05106 [Fonticula alba]|uniref:Serine/threonine-protein phosphatase 2A activator n=1 Tax=Fonticula alba TaxID=691883 RepID=A0A058Z3S7_FONAL|nr:hypothetical protein H696_05106 [Fonticula alba]KCV68177.1 hypothetical protein H696_05106 [Fonticula alba]|eukprot:XP_009497231.1 hypothetical protein H696_05106 [Fonticula alba]
MATLLQKASDFDPSVGAGELYQPLEDLSILDLNYLPVPQNIVLEDGATLREVPLPSSLSHPASHNPADPTRLADVGRMPAAGAPATEALGSAGAAGPVAHPRASEAGAIHHRHYDSGLSRWVSSAAFATCIECCAALSAAAAGAWTETAAKSLESALATGTGVSPAILALRDLFQVQLPALLDEVAPVKEPTGAGRRFGDVAFRTFHSKASQTFSDVFTPLLAAVYSTADSSHIAAATEQLCALFKACLGNPVRLDFGTGHETAFLLLVAGLARLRLVGQPARPSTSASESASASVAATAQAAGSTGPQVAEAVLEAVGPRVGDISMPLPGNAQISVYDLAFLDFGFQVPEAWLEMAGQPPALPGPVAGGLRDWRALALGVLPAYSRTVRLIIRRYGLEPAGSRGAWGLDDYVMLPYVVGSAQLIGHPTVGPMSLSMPNVVVRYASEAAFDPEGPEAAAFRLSTGVEAEGNPHAFPMVLGEIPAAVPRPDRASTPIYTAERLLLDAVLAVYRSKRGTLSVHSPLLHSLSTQPNMASPDPTHRGHPVAEAGNWRRAHAGLMKMWCGEVIRRWPASGHLPVAFSARDSSGAGNPEAQLRGILSTERRAQREGSWAMHGPMGAARQPEAGGPSPTPGPGMAPMGRFPGAGLGPGSAGPGTYRGFNRQM